MKGILWKWLLGLGFMFWMALCCTEYYRNYIQKTPEILYENLKNENVFMKKDPPALTFWKTLSMILSVSALVYIKRSSNLRKNSEANLKRILAKPDEISSFTCKTRVYNNITVYPTSIEYRKCDISPEINSETKNILRKPLPNTIGVEIVQRKLEDLEKSVAILKQRHHATSGAGIVSGSPEFRKFLSSCKKVQNEDSLSDISVNSSQLSTNSNIPGAGLVPTSSSEHLNLQEKEVEIPSESNSSDSLLTCPNIEVKRSVSQNLSVQTKDSSWSTISEASSEISEIKITQKQDDSHKAPIITEIFQVKKTFSKSSLSSKLTNENSIPSLLVENVSSDELTVPGSNPLASSSSSLTSSTLISSSSNYLASFLGGSSTSSDESDSLNTLD